MIALLITGAATARGVSPYLPLNLSPDIEAKIERVMILAGRPMLRRPLAAAAVLDALPAACARDTALCAEVRNYLQRYMRNAGLTQARVEISASSGNTDKTLANRHGLSVDDHADASAGAFYQPGDHLLFSAGVVADTERVTPTGTLVSAGFDFAQLDLGYRDHWLSPFTDGGLLIGTEAPTMPSVTLSNYQPLTRFGFSYEFFAAQMSKSDSISWQGSTTSGHPRLAGLQFSVEPASGYGLALNRVMQYGGGARGGNSLGDLWHAFFNPIKADHINPTLSTDAEFGNQIASISSSLVFSGRIPFVVRTEYAGEDNAWAGNYLFGNAALSWGIEFPALWRRLSLDYEVSEWQNSWYVHHLYGDGLTNDGYVIGHWFGDNRIFGDSIGGRSQTLRAGWTLDGGDSLQLTWRMLANDIYVAGTLTAATYPYRHLQELDLGYNTRWRGHAAGLDLLGGRDVYGANYARLAASLDLAPDSERITSSAVDDGGSVDDDGTELFVDAGAAHSRTKLRLDRGIPVAATYSDNSLHLGLGARRAVSARSDLGARLELDQMAGNSMLSVRALDYRYRLGGHLAFSGFFGAGRYDNGLASFGYYMGAGVQWRNLLPGWDLGADLRHYEKIQRDKLLPGDPDPSGRNDFFYDIDGVALYLSRRFTL
ncbi:MAG: capsule assembly Wzi family protein [Steroidobacteraceae bacterium]